MALQSSADTPPSGPSSSFEQVEMSTRIQIDETVTSSSSPDEIDGRRRPPAATANNSYQSKKLTAEGMMDLSLLTANANQLKFIIFFNQHSKTFIFALSLIVASLILQVVVGALLIFRVSCFECHEKLTFHFWHPPKPHGHQLSFFPYSILAPLQINRRETARKLTE